MTIHPSAEQYDNILVKPQYLFFVTVQFFNYRQYHEF